ncbi:Survival of motor neuron-related-splicing factor 30 [Eumeta japonica]|uniref:Survival of motor neuron-related-splicing factor 30 n=1 Tax=Eumeta variegata TaxID=151549 RepID=A0A4C1ZJM7_EUMVA|nr:Survival of motor neuron-related-splicing factor 30 [Eumeta japonica]
MAEDLRNYKLQLQQVEAALLTDSQNEELLKLKTDLEEVIELTQDLIKTQEGESSVANIHSTSNDDDVTASLLAAENHVERRTTSSSRWRPGDRCLAKWRADGMFYEATVEEVEDDQLRVKFDGYSTLEPVSISDAKKIAGTKRPSSGDESKKSYSREYMKKKKQKKQQRFKQIEEERESEKNKWLSFHTKSLKKPGVRAKSIFASPDNLTGRVGIGTCGISGKPMTEYTPGEKWKKGGRGSFEDEARTARPPTAATQENVKAVEKSIAENLRISWVEFERGLGIGSGSDANRYSRSPISQ